MGKQRYLPYLEVETIVASYQDFKSVCSFKKWEQNSGERRGKVTLEKNRDCHRVPVEILTQAYSQSIVFWLPF
jgi:hypothetical protein